MIVTATEFKTNLGKYLEMAMKQDIFITKNGKNIARLTSPTVNKLAVLDSLVGIVPADSAMDEKTDRHKRNLGHSAKAGAILRRFLPGAA